MDSRDTNKMIDDAVDKLRTAIAVARERLDPVSYHNIFTGINMLIEHYKREDERNRKIVDAAFEAARWRGWAEHGHGGVARALRNLADVIEETTGMELEEYT